MHARDIYPQLTPPPTLEDFIVNHLDRRILSGLNPSMAATLKQFAPAMENAPAETIHIEEPTFKSAITGLFKSIFSPGDSS